MYLRSNYKGKGTISGHFYSTLEMESGARFPLRQSFLELVASWGSSPSLLIFLPLKYLRPIIDHDCDHHKLPFLISLRDSIAVILLGHHNSLSRWVTVFIPFHREDPKAQRKSSYSIWEDACPGPALDSSTVLGACCSQPSPR